MFTKEKVDEAFSLLGSNPWESHEKFRKSVCSVHKFGKYNKLRSWSVESGSYIKIKTVIVFY